MVKINYLDDILKIVADSGESLTWAVSTDEIDAQTGARSTTYGSATNISGVVSHNIEQWRQFGEGIRPGDNFYLFVSGTSTIGVHDKITKDAIDYEVQEIYDYHIHDVLTYRKYLVRRITSDA